MYFIINNINKNLEKEIVLNNNNKINIFLAKAIITEKKGKTIKLENFIKAFNKYYHTYLPTSLSLKEKEKQNIYISYI